jgi:CRP-like cAMP-binding protein
MELIEKVFLLQRVDLLKDARSAHLALLASIAGEVGAEKGAVLIREGEPTEALYVVTRGEVELRGVGGRIVAGEGQAFGTWALIDEAPSLVEARATEASRLLRVRREDFHDLVGDHPELAIGLLQGLARRIRTLVA